MKMDNIKELILKSLDAELSDDEKVLLEEELRKSSSLRKEMEEHIAIRETLQSVDYNFSTEFEDKLMSRIKPVIDLFGSFKKIALSSAVAIALLIVSIYIMDGNININSLFGIHSYPIEDEFYSFLNY